MEKRSYFYEFWGDKNDSETLDDLIPNGTKTTGIDEALKKLEKIYGKARSKELWVKTRERK